MVSTFFFGLLAALKHLFFHVEFRIGNEDCLLKLIFCVHFQGVGIATLLNLFIQEHVLTPFSSPDVSPLCH